jgi:hypothetical protein
MRDVEASTRHPKTLQTDNCIRQAIVPSYKSLCCHRLCRERTTRQALPRTSPLSSPHFGITSLALRRQGNGRMQDHVKELCLSTLGLQAVYREIDGLG